MDLVPKPDQVLAAAGNVVTYARFGRLADLRPMPRTPLPAGDSSHSGDTGDTGAVYHYTESPDVASSGDPVLLVPPLAAPARCYDLRRGCSLVEHLVTTGRPTYLVEYGEVSFRDPTLSLEPWAQQVVPDAVRAVSEHAGGRPVHVVGWSLGGTFTMLAAAGDPDLPIASLSVLGAPVDATRVPLVAPLRPLLDPARSRGLVARVYRAAGAVPMPLVHWTFELPTFQRVVTKPLAIATRLDDTEFLAQVEAVDHLIARMTAYSGRSYGQLYHRFAAGNALATGTIVIGGREVTLASIVPPVLVVAGALDTIAPVDAVRAAVPLLSGSRETRFEIVPGGHLSLLTGRSARESTWPVLDEWFAQWPGEPATKPARKRATTKKTATKKTAAKKTASKRAAKRPRTT